MERNQYDKKDCLEIGLNAQDLFDNIAETRGWHVTKATVDEDMNEHWDRLIKKGVESYKVEVKAMKRLTRHDSNVQDEWVWIELHGVRNYDKGWLYDGKSDIIAFEKKESFLIVKRLDLIDLIPRVVDMGRLVSDVREAKYKIYQRSGRPDKISLIRNDDLLPIKWDEWNKV